MYYLYPKDLPYRACHFPNPLNSIFMTLAPMFPGPTRRKLYDLYNGPSEGIFSRLSNADFQEMNETSP